MPLPVSVAMSSTLIAKELLAFIQHVIDTMDEVSILQICKTNFKEEEISSGKRLLYMSLDKLDQMPSRRRDGTEKSVQDIITLLKVTDPDDVPTFVAKDLHKLPPVTFDHVDVTRLLKDIIFLKTSLSEVQSKLGVSEKTIQELRAEVVLLRNTMSVSRSPDEASKVNTRRGAQNLSVCSFASADFDASAVVGECNAPIAKEVSASTPRRVYADAAARTPSCVTLARVPAPAPARVPARAAPAPCPAPLPAAPSVLLPRRDEDGFEVVQRKKRRHKTTKNRCGKAPTKPEQLVRAAQPNTPVCISRLHYSVKRVSIVEYVRQKLKYTLRVQELESNRNVNFKAFVVRVPNCFLHLVLNEDFWPQNVVFRRFRGQVPPERTKT
ncbi:uncharacterized protein LOC113507811 [Trichoplusia ni]|uniref:Uncharacterized protein LOC113507811 n=1 Tax=Trichoplusia ni TaxID=7111 RepID=A0A7E5X053_TRINI|nr:uncharacterized protein LOC113507811 [Trichoplusia ni]